MNPNYLLKGVLQYELFVRGINSDSDVQTLRKLFRSVVAEILPVDLRNLSIQCVEEPYECVVNKTLELQSLITQQKSESTMLTPRFRTRLSHLRGRLLHLTGWTPVRWALRPRSINKYAIGWTASKPTSPRWTWRSSGSGKGRGRHKQHDEGRRFGTRQLVNRRSRSRRNCNVGLLWIKVDKLFSSRMFNVFL